MGGCTRERAEPVGGQGTREAPKPVLLAASIPNYLADEPTKGALVESMANKLDSDVTVPTVT